MTLLVWLVPVALGMGLVGLLAFLWSMKSGQLEDLDGAAERVLLNEAADGPLPHLGTLVARATLKSERNLRWAKLAIGNSIGLRGWRSRPERR